MKNQRFLGFSLLGALAGCGGGGEYQTDVSNSQIFTASTISQSAIAADYLTTVQRLYVAYFGRPADPAGLANFSTALAATGVSPNIQALDTAYRTNQTIANLINGFGASEESKALYSAATTAEFISSIYRNVLGRDADSNGIRFWSGAIDNGTLTPAHASFSIMAGALANTSSQGLKDAALINNRIAAATTFTNSLEGQTTVGAYSGNEAAATARYMLKGVTESTDPATYQTLVGSTIEILTANSAQVSIASLTTMLPLVAQQFNNCFAAPLNQRALVLDTSIPLSLGGPEVISFGTPCQNIVTNGQNANGYSAFLHDGFRAGQFFYQTLASASMTGAIFSVPEIMLFTAASDTASGRDEAVLNFRYIDNTGTPGNFITIAHNIPGSASSTHPSDWWLAGNQHRVEANLYPVLRRFEQLGPSPVSFHRSSRFQSGIQIAVNVKGPGSINVKNELLNMARVSGPGLPTGGLVYRRSSMSSAPLMDIFNKTGSLTVGGLCGNLGFSNCPNFWVAATKGISGTDAATLAANPANYAWAQSSEGAQPELMVKGAKYKIELFYGANTESADMVFYKPLLTNVVSPTIGSMQAWHAMGDQFKQAMDPTGAYSGNQTALGIDWIRNLSALPISEVTAAVDGSNTFSLPKFVAKGATSVVLDNVTVPAFSSSLPRSVILTYGTLDGGRKSAMYMYN